MTEKIYISERFFTKEELDSFVETHGYSITDISYSSTEGEIDFSSKEEKEYLLREGHPRILARFFF
jgi:hypothetical protein